MQAIWQGRVYCHLRVLVAEQQVLQALGAARFAQVRAGREMAALVLDSGSWNGRMPVVQHTLTWRESRHNPLLVGVWGIFSAHVRSSACPIYALALLQAAEQLAALTALLDRFPQMLHDCVPAAQLLLGALCFRCMQTSSCFFLFAD